MHQDGLCMQGSRAIRASIAWARAMLLPPVLSKLLGLGQVKEESRRGNGTVTLGWAPVRPPPEVPAYRRAPRRPAN